MISPIRTIAAALAITLGACAHTPPGTSVELALAKRADLIRMPAPPKQPGGIMGHGPAVEPALPENDHVDKIADAFTRGNFCMRTGNDSEAIKAFEEVVKLDPGFSEAWQNLAILYDKTGDSKKAVEAFRRSKKVAKQ